MRGTVQGVGFRPFVYRTARALGIGGSVANTTAGVTIEAEGAPEALAGFVRAMRQGPPPPARVAAVEVLALAPSGETAFAIGPSAEAGARSATILPDLATCEDCLREIFDPRDRRYRYPFTNCTHCGPRYSIIEDLPYDRGAHVDAALPDVRGLPRRIRGSGGPPLPRRAQCLPCLRAELGAVGSGGEGRSRNVTRRCLRLPRRSAAAPSLR